jgi:glutathione synthase/RimK-type ligase-like ATP-grasp enzyme
MDENQNLYLMEINMSPNITPTAKKYEKNAKIREKMVYDTVSLVGIASEFDLMAR